MDSLDPEELLTKLAHHQSLSTEEVSSVLNTLKLWGKDDKAREISLDDLFNFLVVCKKANLKEHHRLIANFLNLHDALTVSFVLELLCIDWQLSAEYLEHAVSISIGVSWDSEGDAREQGLRILGEYLRSFNLERMLKTDSKPRKIQTNEKEVLNLLFSTLEDQSNNPFVRQAAYIAICRGFGKDWEYLPGECVLLDFDMPSENVDTNLLNEARRFIDLLGPQSS